MAAVLVLSGWGIGKARAEDLEATSDPYKQGQGNVSLGLLKGRVRGCPTNVNPNCVSTSSLSTSYQTPWKAPEGMSMKEACELIKDTLLGKGAVLREYGEVSETDPELGTYLRFDLEGNFGREKPDHVEFLVRKTDPVNWEGESSGLSVFFRSIAGGVRYIYPIQQPITDFSKQRKRMEGIRNDLGWRLSGCELIECYE
ncbi:hypothetical protein HOP50_10g57970 [Chloropicon primus]|uniref:Uncharacterized protein n=1 Tax=Chloropicon primus TaxID=1764295 RepID=A0A5B8MRP0_9CHLO|nr:hypothetical protein A3770_10p57770 [Chloropicon primus]UPR02471.1 hypothetical protein HOP50_10g57970 [Chloropicon primus]|eukprot:QDZ23259.1 hypothetical protein A3770_10p57770 [Chloropicon primus]